jgi:lipocalin
MENFKHILGTIVDHLVVNQYKKFIGEEELVKLLNLFEKLEFLGKWEQVLTSRSTGLFGTGITYSSVQATYTPGEDGLVNVKNEAYDDNLKKTIITGVSRARKNSIPTCRTVKFPSLLSPECDYWIVFISNSCKSIIVSAPIIVPGIPRNITNNFGVYVLTKDRDFFWNSKEEQKDIFDALKKYGFTNFWNKGIFSGESISIN